MKGIKFHRIPQDKSLASMLVNHELDAATVGRAFSREWNIIDRSTTIRAQDADWSKVKPLFPDPKAEAERFVKQHGFVPANHGYAIRGDVYRQHPWIAFNLYKAFLEAKRVWAENFSDSVPSGLFFGPQYIRETTRIVGEDPFAYGVKANRAMLETAVKYSNQQGFIPDIPKIEDLFAEQLRDL
jgi:4,5-dihydroxyphthalate decarboxylase